MIDNESFRNGTVVKTRVRVTYFAVANFCFHKKTRTIPNHNFELSGPPPSPPLYMIYFNKSFSTPVTSPALTVTPAADRWMLCILAQGIPLGLEDSFLLMQVSEA